VDLVALSAWVADALTLVLVVSAPALLVSLVVGGVMGLVQSATEIHDPAIGFVPRVAAVGATLAFGGAWMGTRIVEYTGALWQNLPGLLQ
jgi:flagellar biosynthetic protein FliQ